MRGGRTGDETEAMEQDERLGVLVGWSSQNVGANILLDLQTFEETNWSAGDDPGHTRVFMTRSQAAVLANHLLKVSGSLPPTRRKSLLASLFR
jgi:hypothetical protein